MSDLPRLLSFTLDGWPVLGGPVTITLNDGVAVLVGRNGAGKSAILEGFKAISTFAMGGSNSIRPIEDEVIPIELIVEISTPTSRRIEYKYELIGFPPSADELDNNNFIDSNSEEKQFSWNESCQYVDHEREFIWTTKSGVTTFHNKKEPRVVILGSISSLQRLHFPESLELELPDEMRWVRLVLNGVRLLGKHPTRKNSQPRSSSFFVVPGRRIFHSHWDWGELSDLLSRKIFHLIEKKEKGEIESICQRIGLGNRITEEKFFPEGKDNEYYVQVLLDGVNIGLLSDGTLRLLSILIDIINSTPTSTLIIEEPEIRIHPGMLAKLLNEIESYTYGQNLILSTHSPQVVSWTQPDKINVVYRENDRTFVRKLANNEIESIVAYLNEEGSLGDWVYSGILDE
jgi:ABC-type multidrug transport system ATPase subunit